MSTEPSCTNHPAGSCLPVALDRPLGKKRGRKPRPIVEFPVPLTADFVDPPGFAEAFALQLARHGDSYFHLHRSLIRPEERFHRKTFAAWATGTKVPNAISSFEMLERVERRYRLPSGYFRGKLTNPARAASGHRHLGVSRSERRRLAWHLPADFDGRSPSERAQILDWVRTVMVSGSTEFRRYLARATKDRYGLRFPPMGPGGAGGSAEAAALEAGSPDSSLRAPAQLVDELREFIRFKTATFPDAGIKRVGVWNQETVAQRVEHLGLMLGALAADPTSSVKGYGVSPDRLSLCLLVCPGVWDWYLRWREARRGFFTVWEVDMLSLAASLTRRETGWLRQNPGIAVNLRPIAGLVSESDVACALSDWDAVCDAAHEHARSRSREIARVARVHRDPFEAILPILEDASPVGAYRRITIEIAGRMPDRDRYPRASAEATRSFLMLRLGLHLGVRQKNLRQLLFCPRGRPHRSERQLEDMGRGELRWHPRDEGWEVLIPSMAFKNANSSFFGNRPFRLLLPDLDGLYGHIDAYLSRHRSRLLNGADDPGTFFVRTVKRTSRDAAYSGNTFYEAWRLIIQRYGIYNPFTGRGAIEGLLPHGPHNVRDVLATHVLKKTGSYEQASYAIQDTPEMVEKHYGRFLPQDKAAFAARILNQAWEVD
ncbi:MAG TPA: hypothetical protein VMG08_19460 [Allosphingosinicella sp.]|nr:hypothetical protein [Allosphingosinicella sp.]